VALQKGCW